MNRYEVRVDTGIGGHLSWRTVEFDGGQIRRAWRDDEEVELAPDYALAIASVLRSHEASPAGRRGGGVTITVTPLAALGEHR